MVGTQILDDKIKESGLKTSFIITKLGISRSGYYKKKAGIIPFRTAEIYLLGELLNLSDIDKQAIFFGK